MNRLSEVIGLAPSELSHEALLAKLTIERNRVRQSLISFRTQKQIHPKVAKSTKVLPSLASLGLTPEQFTRALELIREGK